MEALRGVVGVRENEFTGLKGDLLRYLGSAFFLTVLGLLVVAAGERHLEIAGAAEVISTALFALAASIYPLVVCARHLGRMEHAYRAGETFEIAGVVLWRYGREAAAAAEEEHASALAGEDLVMTMRAEGSAAVLERLGRDGAYEASRAVYQTGIAVAVLLFTFVVVLI